MAHWRAVVADLELRNRAFVPFEGLTLTRRLNGWADVAFACDALDDAAAELLPAERTIKLYSEGVVRFVGKIGEPHDDTPEQVSVAAYDPFWWCQHRRIYPLAAVTNAPVLTKPRVFTQKDAGKEIAKVLVDESHARSTTRIRTSEAAAIQASVKRGREYEPGKQLEEAIDELANVDEGFFFRIDPVEGPVDAGGKALYGDLIIRWPQAGGQSFVRWEYGDGTIGNLDDFTRSALLPTNAVTAVGAGGALAARVTDVTSVARYDLIETEVSFESVSIAATLTQHAVETLDSDVRYRYEVTPAAAGEWPRLFEDFDVGDIIRLTIRGGRVNDVDVPVRVHEATLAVADESHDERLTALVLEQIPSDEPV